MCPPAPPLQTDDISFCWTDEEIFQNLQKMIRGFPPPNNVLDILNPYQHEPSKLPEGFWYFLGPDVKKDAEAGFWKAKGEACRIFKNSDITGWRTTFEFYEGQDPCGNKTDWVMQEYRITQKGMHRNCWPKDSSSLCRFFSSESSTNEMQHSLAGPDVASGNCIPSMLSVIHSEKNNNTGQGSTSKSQVNSGDDETKPLPLTERFLNHPVEIVPPIDCISSGDYLELRDLCNPVSSSSSSENSSFRSMSSDECFDSLALLRDLESEDKKNTQQKNADCKFSVSAPVRPDEVVICPATAGSPVSGNGSKSSAEALKRNRSPASAIEEKPGDKKVFNPAIRTHKADCNNGSSAKSRNAAASSSGHKLKPDRGEKETAIGRSRKLKKKYFCFFPF